MKEWNKRDRNFRNAKSYEILRKSLLRFIQPSPNSVCNYHNTKGINLLSKLSPGLSHLYYHKLKYNFQGFLNAVCNCEKTYYVKNLLRTFLESDLLEILDSSLTQIFLLTILTGKNSVLFN